MDRIQTRRRLRSYLPIIIILLIFLMFWLLLFLSPWKYISRIGEEHWWMYYTLNIKHYGFLTPVGPYGHLGHFSPLYAWVNYLAITTTGWIEAGRLISLLFGIGTLFLMFKISKLWYDRKTGYLAMLLLALSPLFLQGSVNIKRGTMMLFFSALAFFFLIKYLESRSNCHLFSMSAAAFLSAFSKEAGIFTLVGVGIYLLYRKRLEVFKSLKYYVAMLAPVFLMFLWYVHIEHAAATSDLTVYPSAFSVRLFFNLKAPLIKVLRETSIELAVAIPVTTLFLALVGIGRREKQDYLALSWLASGILFYLIFLQGSYHHTHYSTFMLPPLAIFGARGVTALSGRVASRIKTRKNLVLLLISGILVSITAGGLGFIYHSLLQPNQGYEKEIRMVGNYVQKNAGENGTVALGRFAVYYHTPEIDIARVKGFKSAYPQTLENLEEHPKMIVVYIKSHPDLGWMGRQSPTASENDIERILTMDNYRISKEFTYFYVITKKG